MPAEALSQSVEIPLWMLVVFMAYSERRLVQLLGPVRERFGL